MEDRGFRYGMSVFETIAISSGRSILADEHLQRLALATQSVGWGRIVVPRLPLDLAEGGSTGVVRIYVTAGPGHPGDPFSGSVYALFEECDAGTEFSPVRIASSSAPYLPAAGGWKTGNYWQNVSAQLSAKSGGVDDVLLFNPSGALVCASMANVFLETGGIWKTPPVESGARDGVMRDWVIKHSRVEQTLLGPDDVAGCTGCFLTNSRIGLRAVSEIDGRPLQTEVTGLQQLCRDLVFSA